MTERQKFTELLNSLRIDNNPANELIYAGTLLQRAARLWPNKVALIFQEETITYKELYYRATLFSKKLELAGIKARDKVLILYENSINFYIAYYGAWQTGAIVAPVNTFLKDHELRHIINDAQPAALVVSEPQRAKLPVDITLPKIFDDADIDRTTPITDLDYSCKTLSNDELAVLLYTSGTTGLPKGVMLSSRNILMNIAQGRSVIDIAHEVRALAALPLFHSFMQSTCVWGVIIVGATTIIVPKIDRRRLLEGIAHKPTMVLGIPGLFGLFCLLKTLNFDDVTYFVCGGDALPDKIRAGFELIYQRKLCNGYGLTESSPFVAADLQDMTEPTNTVGFQLIETEIQIRDTDNSVLPHGRIGALWVKGPQVMLGYYNAPEATAKVLKDGWLNTGDLATINERGKIIICGREKDIIINKGIKIYPQESENILMLHPNVIMAAVVGLKDTTEEIPVAFVMVKEQYPELANELKELCIKNLAMYKVPRQFFLERELPLTATGKVDKKVLRARINKE